ncbi:ABC-F family ATP-binding cassette domain-containing protein [Pengzhenrongella frigida]|uniref:ABC-F family ATP-binding cassette domain-containing protein n=1 Tax=Pengzhenrongella frigida TaxID=1259133 RepID=A0A4Q5MXJ8_9MICO|nr:ABC-F family ATP-binding cassette domain-containing protein [Cellulomonas sp. HLT2-17]RYV50369.1 ABC-F family ATP-binding cassette domain-containing protein [Cellulomonas sp. HLT2-17]
MAHLLGADSISLTLGTRTLFDSVSLGIDDGDRIGVVGPNGAGKSTLLGMLAGRGLPDAGRITRAGGADVALLDQRDELPAGTTIRELVHGASAEHTWASDPRVRSVHAGLLSDLDLDSDVATLSGGQRRRTALAALLVGDHDIIALDEPTNHLDVEGVAWLAEHLSERFGRGSQGKGALIVVTHDRWFLDAVCTRMWEVTGSIGFGEVAQYEGGYAAYVLARAERARSAASSADKRNNLLRKELAWLHRGARARSTKPKYRMDAAEALIADEPPPRDPLELTRMATSRLGKDVLDLEGVTLRFGGDVPGAPPKVLFDDLTWRLGPGDRYGIVGVNGSGKTSLLRLLAGKLTPTSGRVKRGKTIQVAELTQDVEDLDAVAGLSVVEVIESEKRVVSVGGKELTAAQLVERLGFTNERARTLVRELSGGERRRLQLLRLLVGEPNVLLLDEPTNDLDTDTLAALEDLLDGWPGTLIVVSHDRYLLERVCDRQVALMGDGAIRDLPGGVEQYLELRHAAELAAESSPVARAEPVVAQADTDDTAPSAAESRAARKELARIDRRLAKIAQLVKALHAKLADQSTDFVAVAALDAELRALAAERGELEELWLELSESA